MPSITSELDRIIKAKSIKYNDLKVRLLIIKYKKNLKDVVLLNTIQENCYPVILGALKKFLSTHSFNSITYQQEELLSESILVLQKCIFGYSFKSKNKFITYFWDALINRYKFLLYKTDTPVKKIKREDCYSVEYFEEDTNDNIENALDRFVFVNGIFTEMKQNKLLNRQVRDFLSMKLTFIEFKIYIFLRGNATKENNSIEFTATKLRVTEKKVEKTITKIQKLIVKELEL